MKAFRSSLLVGAALVLGSVVTANAADLGFPRGPSMKDTYMPAPVSVPRWYMRIDGGYAWHDDPSILEAGIYDLVHNGIDPTWTLGGGFGYYFTQNIRGDLTFDYRFQTDVKGFNSDVTAPFGGGYRVMPLKSTVYLANLYYDFDRSARISPYVGIGLGFVHHKTGKGSVTDACGCVGEIDGASSTDVAGALMAGFTFNLASLRHQPAYSTKDGIVAAPSSRLLLDVGYRFLYLGETHTGVIRGTSPAGPVGGDPDIKSIHAHELRVGLRWNLQ
ncbi:MAG: outer membrane beta-barrel protein [Hyphomicrobiaceae bacterium]